MLEHSGPRASRPQTIRLREIKDRDSGLVGAKALSLARMMRARLPVPPGFCVTGAAYREHLNSAPLADRARALLDDLGNRGDKMRALTELREAIVEAPLSDRLAREIEGRYRALGQKPRLQRPRLISYRRRPLEAPLVMHVAVRSSATAEDLPGHSFAGQYDTFLGVTDLAGCLDAVRKCWASLWTERAFGYRQRNGIDHRTVDMAVIVQELVPAEASGVLFTADPVTGRRDRLVIESCFGLGETLVSGKVTPDRFVLSKRKLRVLERSVATKTVETVLDPTGGVRERTVAGGRAARPCLNDAAARRLGKLALKAEKAFGSPQDVEWAAASGRLYILQSRPITTLAPEKSREDRQVWTNANTGEVLPDVVTPLTWSFIQFMLNSIFRGLFGRTMVDLGGAPAITLIAGRGYFNINTLIGMASGIPFAGDVNSEITRILGGSEAAVAALDRITKDDVPRAGTCGHLRSRPDGRVKLGRLRMLLGMPGLVRWLLWHTPRRALFFLAAKRRKTERLKRLDLGRLPVDEIVPGIRDAADDLCRTPTGLLYPIMAMAYFMLLDRVCRRWLDDPEGTIARRLVTGLPGMQPAEAGLALWRLASLAREHPGVEKAIVSELPWDAARDRIGGLSGGDEFLARWNDFMDEHGHHTRGELEYLNPRWCERPDDVLGMVRGYLDGLDATDPVARQRQLAAERVALATECRRSLRNPVKRVLFDCFLARAQLGSVIRENTKSEAVRRLTVIRRMLLELGERLARLGVLSEREDIFFLRLEELGPACAAEAGRLRRRPVRAGRAGLDVRETVAARRAEYRRNLTIVPPAVVVGRFDPDDFAGDSVDTGARELTGVAASAGLARGRARVILRTGTDQVLPGEILVAPFTDPGWTPYFLNAAGIVMDMGGMLSHGSIIAREYGIPAVVNVGPATRIIKTGQMLHVDGDRGRVRILE